MPSTFMHMNVALGKYKLLPKNWGMTAVFHNLVTMQFKVLDQFLLFTAIFLFWLVPMVVSSFSVIGV